MVVLWPVHPLRTIDSFNIYLLSSSVVNVDITGYLISQKFCLCFLTATDVAATPAQATYPDAATASCRPDIRDMENRGAPVLVTICLPGKLKDL